MNYEEFYQKMQECRLVSDKWRNLLKLLVVELHDDNNSESALKLFTLYFSLIDDGNTFMLLEKEKVLQKFKEKAEEQIIESKEEEREQSDYNDILTEIENALKNLDVLKTITSVIGKDKLFEIDNDRLFAVKYIVAVNSIKSSAERLFKPAVSANEMGSFSVDEHTQNITLETEQKEVVEKGLLQNLIVTGGPGTGKTTSIVFLLAGLLSSQPDLNVYLAAPSGKAADRIGESINKEKEHIKDVDKSVLDKIFGLKGTTIHTLLKIDRDTNHFVYNKERQFEKNSVFIIDEASMIDVCLFASLLEAIPNGARVFILGDKNQLPSVECGAVFAELLKLFSDNVVELIKAQRFGENSDVFKLAEQINSGKVNVSENVFQKIDDFHIVENEKDKSYVYYYDDLEKSNKDMVLTITKSWYNKFFCNFQETCKKLSVTKDEIFKKITEQSENAKILCAQNESSRGATAINKAILDTFYKGKKISGFYPGEILMVKKNLKSLDLYNGDCGITVMFDGDETLYFMIQKASNNLHPEEGKKDNMLFKIGDYFFYPIRMIGLEDITSGFAITIHKSQGSGYNNVLIVLPKAEKHPLLNRQLVYTAITRTKGNAYIISSKANLEYAAKNELNRETGLVK